MPAELSAVAVLLLALLHEQPMHPYQLHQTLLERGDARLVRINAGSVYHGVERLERDGLVEAVGTDRAGRRPERTTYRLTDAGREAFARRLTSLLGDDHPAYPLFTVGLAEANELPAGAVADQLERRLARERGRLEHLAAAYEQLRELGLPRRFLLDVEYDEARLRHEVEWLERTIGELRGHHLDWGEPVPADFVHARQALRTAGAPTTAGTR
ncbi:PadR family transcriptional regulator [Cellulomonas alba]|uniref:PadR family transcriptional regulator n=1 Tax=Cellulomonas alba TaxID=3053467 RepID=A0ABT7SHG3_9CELL|nr:PadR family transcriptional regulator [Cellulomonas alba]MDM7855628.1 PadR family transcriptional regulator [Cellulomonas alba]